MLLATFMCGRAAAAAAAAVQRLENELCMLVSIVCQKYMYSMRGRGVGGERGIEGAGELNVALTLTYL